MKDKITRIIIITLFSSVCAAFVVKFGGPAILRGYIASTLGDCKKIPVYCMSPGDFTDPMCADTAYIRRELIQCQMFKMQLCIPRGFLVVEEKTRKIYRKRKPNPSGDSVIFLFHKPPGFFTGLFPQLKKNGILNDYDFLKTVMNTRLDKVNTINEVFFMIMKGVFICDLGPQKNAQMLSFASGPRKGFINYNLTPSGNYFDAKFVDEKEGFFSIYIKDKNKELDLKKACAIISTMENM